MAETPKWEYRAATLGTYWTGPRDEDLEAMLNEWGQDGWDLVAVTKIENSNKIRLVAKRPLPGAFRKQQGWP
jgi:hypothetical protein